MQGKTLGDNNVGCVAPSPSLVMLVGCFQDEIFGPEMDGDEEEEGGEDIRVDDRREAGESRLCVLSKGIQMGGASIEAYPDDTRGDRVVVEEEDRIRLEYLRLAGQAMSEVKDGLEWIERER